MFKSPPEEVTPVPETEEDKGAQLSDYKIEETPTGVIVGMTGTGLTKDNYEDVRPNIVREVRSGGTIDEIFDKLSGEPGLSRQLIAAVMYLENKNN